MSDILFKKPYNVFGITGHRASKLGLTTKQDCDRLMSYCHNEVMPSTVYALNTYLCGMQSGFDLAMGVTALRKGHDVIAVIPFDGFLPSDGVYWQNLFHFVCDWAKEKKVVCVGGYEVWKLHKRNQYIVDNCYKLLTLWDGVKSGGTWNCIQYADKKFRLKKEYYLDWKEYEKGHKGN